jgi:hypothetical protein
MFRNRLLRVVVLSLPLIVFTACNELTGNDGGQCDRCSRDSDCRNGRTCFPFSDGNSRCATEAGQTCLAGGLSSTEPSSTALGPSGQAGLPWPGEE